MCLPCRGGICSELMLLALEDGRLALRELIWGLTRGDPGKKDDRKRMEMTGRGGRERRGRKGEERGGKTGEEERDDTNQEEQKEI